MKTWIERSRMAFSVYSSRSRSMNYQVIALITLIIVPLAALSAETNKPNILVTLTD